ncbi:MAG: hypothetical protein LBJ38_01650 [Oscillospiraceae bacterium]|nr:hypothetical protein [Oscillospiraceae bacterium]
MRRFIGEIGPWEWQLVSQDGVLILDILFAKTSRFGDLIRLKTCQKVEVGSCICFLGPSNNPEYAEVFSKRAATPNEEAGELPEILRVADENDKKTLSKFANIKARAITQCKALIQQQELGMKLCETEYDHHKNKFFFYFKSEKRIDFRQLAKDLACKLRAKIEFRQLNVREQAMRIGGLGLCGREACCRSLPTLKNFDSKALKKAREAGYLQSKVYGACGRFMCCLAFEQLSSYQPHNKKTNPTSTQKLTTKPDHQTKQPSTTKTKKTSKPLQPQKGIPKAGNQAPQNPKTTKPPMQKRAPKNINQQEKNKPELPARPET